MDNAGNGGGYERERSQDLDIVKKTGSIVQYPDT